MSSPGEKSSDVPGHAGHWVVSVPKARGLSTGHWRWWLCWPTCHKCSHTLPYNLLPLVLIYIYTDADNLIEVALQSLTCWCYRGQSDATVFEEREKGDELIKVRGHKLMNCQIGKVDTGRGSNRALSPGTNWLVWLGRRRSTTIAVLVGTWVRENRQRNTLMAHYFNWRVLLRLDY